MTNRLDHLEERGLVRRSPDPVDGRSLRIRLTAAGQRRADDALRDLVGIEDGLLGNLDPNRRATLAELLKTLLTPFEPPL
jgi:DNA-binding MarR family transcriptional regulator